jgi:sulfite exporter TauE/SafE
LDATAARYTEGYVLKEELFCQMRMPRLSSFTVIGAILIFIGVYGIAHGSHFQYDLGVQADSSEGFYYLVVGALMILNGYFWLPLLPEEKKEPEKKVSAASGADRK